MSLDRYREISPAPERHSMALFDEVFSQMQSSTAARTKQASSDLILFTNIFSMAGSKSQIENVMVDRTGDGRQITIESDGSILLGQPISIAN